jgi:hypothetical protein
MTRTPNQRNDLPPELREVVDAADALVRAHANDDEAVEPVQKRSLQAARVALEAGYSLSDMATAEEQGRRRAREQLRGDLLRRVARSAKRVQEATEEHHSDIRRASQIGLSTREIAIAADVAHGTVRAIINRGGNGSVAEGPEGPGDEGSQVTREPAATEESMQAGASAR